MSANTGSVWITANAGSGKTTYLTRRVLSLLVQGVTPEKICCITYTKAAASEMRHRIVKQLRNLYLADDTACEQILSDLLARPASPEEMQRARSLFGSVLDSETGGLFLTTIHGFCQAILRRFPLEAGINPHFTVLEEAAADELINRCKARLLSHYEGGHPALDEALRYIAACTKEGRFEDYINAIIGQRAMWETLWRGESEASLKEKIYTRHNLTPSATQQALTNAFAATPDAQTQAMLRGHLPALLAASTKTQLQMAQALERWLAQSDISARVAQVEEYCDAFVTQSYSVRQHLLSKKDYPEGTPLHSQIQRLAMQALEYRLSIAALHCAEESYAIALLARELLELYRQAKESSHALDYDDLVVKTRELFASPAMIGWVMSKLDHRIDHLLIDEAQDTSADQWAISGQLVEELIAAGGEGSGGLPRSLLVVGDEKQSIYSFNGARPELFAAQKHQIGALIEQTGHARLSEESLAKSYRSSAAVLQLVDMVAQQTEIAATLSSGGAVPPHQLVRSGAAGSVTLYPLISAPEDAPGPQPLTLPHHYASSQTAPQLLAQQVAATIASWLSEGRVLENTGNPVRPGDILVLVSKRSAYVLPLIRALQRRAVPVAGIDRLTLSGHLAVKDLLALMRWVISPADDLALAQILRSPLIGLSDDALRAWCVNRPGSLWAAIPAGEFPLLTSALSRAHATPYDFITHILETCGARTQMAERFGEEVHEVLDELKSQLANLPAQMPETLAHAHDWLSGSARQIKREQESAEIDEVRIMTVHGAKGLEAPIVLLIDTTRVPTTQQEVVFFAAAPGEKTMPVLAITEGAKAAPALQLAKQQKLDALVAEYNRLLYVALTRARDELHIWGACNGAANPKSWYSRVEMAMMSLGASEEEGRRIWRCTRTAQVESVTQKQHALLLPMPAWATSPVTELAVRDVTLSPSRLTERGAASEYVANADANARTRGVYIHRLLELVNADSTPAEIARLAKWIAPQWPQAERESTASALAELISQHRWIWQSPSLAEVNIAGTLAIHGRSVPLAGQIDRLVEMPDALVVIDYKTGAHVPQTAEAIPETYLLQMKAYQQLLRAMHPDKTVRCALLWTAVPTLMWCDDEVEQASWPQRQDA